MTLGLDTILKPTLSIYQEIETRTCLVLPAWSSPQLRRLQGLVPGSGGNGQLYAQHASHDMNISAFHDGNLSAGLKIPLNNYLSIKPNIQWSFPLSSAAADRIKAGGLDGHQNTFVYGGLILDLAI